MIGLLIYLIFIAMGFYITYLIIKVAVKHAIRESLDYVQIIIKDSIKSSLSEYNWDKDNE
jgi:hypothetical protein